MGPTKNQTVPPREYVCPISNQLMVDPVNVSSGHTFERTSVQICKELRFLPILPDGTTPSFSGSVNPNSALRAVIQSWCDANHFLHPPHVDYYAVEEIVRSLIAEADSNLYKPTTTTTTAEEYSHHLIDRLPFNQQVIDLRAVTLPPMRRTTFGSGGSSSSSSVIDHDTPLNFKTTPASYANPRNWEHGNRDADQDNSYEYSDRLLITKLMSTEAKEQEQGVITIRELTRTNEQARSSLCNLRMLSLFRPLILSTNETIQVNATASLVNISLEKPNKSMIVSAGLIPPLIHVLKYGFEESQEHAAGAIFSLSLEEDNQTAIGVLGGLEPLLNSIRVEEISDRTRHDSALALYHLTSLNNTNRVKLVSLGAVGILLTLLKSKNMVGRAILVLCNLAQCGEGKAAMLDENVVKVMIKMVREGEFEEATLGNVVATLCALSHGSLRFRGLAMDAGAVEVLRGVEARSRSERTRERARRVLAVLQGYGEENDGLRMFDSGGTMRVPRKDMYTAHTATF